MRKSACYLAALVLLLCGLIFSFKPADDKYPTLAIGAKAPDFKLKGVDDKVYTLNSFKNSPILVVIFTCNHCPTAQAYEERIIQLTKDYKDKGVAVVAIQPNDPKALTLDELGWSDLNDTFEEMKIRAKQKNFNFAYLDDGDTQATTKAYGAVATPHVFIFDKNRELRYTGRIDDVEKPTKIPRVHDTRNAITSLLDNKPPAVATTKVFGCSVKWAAKEGDNEKLEAAWNKLPVKIDTITEVRLKDVLTNKTDKLIMVNVWATWCGPCVAEFPNLIELKRRFSRRDFELVTISADDPTKKDKALKFLQEMHASGPNYIFNIDDKYKLIEAIDPKWQGALPYTMLVEPGGKVIYSTQGLIDPEQMKKIIVDNKFIGRYF